MTKEITWGLISKIDSETIMKTLDLVNKSFAGETINVLELGVYGGDTGNGMRNYIASLGLTPFICGIDNFKDSQPIYKSNFYDRFIQGNSHEVYNKVENDSQHVVFIDACHCLPHVIADYYCYSDKVKDGGFLMFHDTGKHIKPYKDFQHGHKDNPDAYISVRKALEKIGLLNNTVSGWRLIFDEADETNEAGGICVFKKYEIWE